LKIVNLKKMSIPKLAVLATGLTAAIVVATMSPQAAQATPTKAKDCTGCHGSGSVAGTVTLTPSTISPAAGAAYTLAISFAATNGGNTGFWIANSDAAGTTGTTTGVTGGPGASSSFTASMTAPAAAGTYYYKVWVNQGMDDTTAQANFKTYSITVGSAATTPPVTTPPVTTPATPPTGVHGFATANGSTTGGAGGSTVTVTSLSAFKTAAAGSAPEVIKVSGNFASTGSEVTVASNKTIIGVGSGSGLTGIGLSIKGVSNVIVRNLKISKVLASSGNGDSIHIEKSNHVWIDHNDLSSDTSHGTDYYDGQLDITHAADYITVSYNYIHDHIKCSLVGHSDSNASEDTGHLHVTYDHNYFRNCDQRTPSLRFGTGHVYDNYFDGASTGSTGIHSRMGAQMLVQNNVFRNVKVPIETTKDSDVDGFVNQTGNDFGGGSNLITQTGSFTNPPYSYALDPTTSVINLVTANAGTGKVG